MLADRRDLMVATYSSVRGTAAMSIIFVLTGIACGAACLASVLLHPVVTREINKTGRTSRNEITNESRFILLSSKVTICPKDARQERRDSELVPTIRTGRQTANPPDWGINFVMRV